MRKPSAENEDLRRVLATQSFQFMEHDSRCREYERLTRDYALQLKEREKELLEKDRELGILEQEMQRLTLAEEPCIQKCDKAGSPECPGPDLCGKRILYIGGRINLVRHYKALVERHGGHFLHHDGGLEETGNLLPKLLKTADAVLCPVDCVSHNASLAVKNACRNKQHDLRFLRSSGLSSLMRSLHDLAGAHSSLEHIQTEAK